MTAKSATTSAIHTNTAICTAVSHPWATSAANSVARRFTDSLPIPREAGATLSKRTSTAMITSSYAQALAEGLRENGCEESGYQREIPTVTLSQALGSGRLTSGAASNVG